MGHALLLRGSLDEAAAILRDGVGRCLEQTNLRLAGWAHVYLALMASARGDALAAERDARAAETLLAGISPPLWAWAQATLSRALLGQGRIAEALSAAQVTSETAERLGGVTHGGLAIELALGQALDAAGDKARARAVVAASRHRALEQFAGLESPGFKACFLKHPDRASVLALADAWLSPVLAEDANRPG